MTIDFHTHCFPDSIAGKAISKLSAAAGSEPVADGTVSGLVNAGKAAGISLSVVCSIATNPHQEHKVNCFAVSLNDRVPEVAALGSLHPDSENTEDELDYLADHDIKGIKIHPEYAGYYIDSPEWDRILSACEERGFFVVTHAGRDFISPDRIAVTPQRLAKVLDRHKNLTVVAAHLGGNRLWDDVLTYLCGREKLYFDTALIAREGINPETAEKIIAAHGADRILFGSDCPWSSPAKELEFVLSLGLGAEKNRLILSENAEKLLFG